MAKAPTDAGMLPVGRVYETREDRPRRDDRQAQREHERTRERARARQKREWSSVCGTARAPKLPLPRCALTRPDACACLAGHPPLRARRPVPVPARTPPHVRTHKNEEACFERPSRCHDCGGATSSLQVHRPGAGPPRLSRPVARAPWHRTWREGGAWRRSAVNCDHHSFIAQTIGY